jgi:hypothetical protein
VLFTWLLVISWAATFRKKRRDLNQMADLVDRGKDDSLPGSLEAMMPPLWTARFRGNSRWTGASVQALEGLEGR